MPTTWDISAVSGWGNPELASRQEDQDMGESASIGSDGSGGLSAGDGTSGSTGGGTTQEKYCRVNIWYDVATGAIVDVEVLYCWWQ